MNRSETLSANDLTMRKRMHEMLATLPESHRNLFRRMYNHKGIHARDVDGVRADQMDWAFQQIERSIAKIATNAEAPQ